MFEGFVIWDCFEDQGPGRKVYRPPARVHGPLKGPKTLKGFIVFEDAKPLKTRTPYYGTPHREGYFPSGGQNGFLLRDMEEAELPEGVGGEGGLA